MFLACISFGLVQALNTGRLDWNYKKMGPVYQDWVVCRVCLHEENNMESIFNRETTEDLPAILYECGGMPVLADDNLPDKICQKCMRCLRIANKFRKTCQESYNHLTDLLASDGTPVECVEEENTACESVVTGVVHIVDENNDIIETTVDCDDEYIKLERLDDNGDHDDSIQYEFYEPTAEEIIEGEYTDLPAYEIIEETNGADSVSIDDDIAKDILSSDDDYQPSSNVQRRNVVVATGIKILPSELVSEAKKKGRKPKDKAQTYICDVCGNIYRTQARLTEHMKFHSGIKPHECEICGRGFVQNQQLVRHMNTHTGNRPYKCNYCPAAFADRSTKTKHHRIHTKQRPYECDVCRRTFTYSDNLKFHKMIHTGEKPHACDVCGKGFTKAYKMRLHRKTHEKRGIVPPEAPSSTATNENIKLY